MWVIALDIEKTGVGGKIISVGIACVDSDIKETIEKRLIHFPRPAFPCDHRGSLFTAEAKLPQCKDDTEQMIGVFREPEGPICDYGDFEKRCADEFWLKNPEALIANIQWNEGPLNELVADEKEWVDEKSDMASIALVYATVYRLCTDALEIGKDVRIVSDNPAFDIGSLDAELECLVHAYRVEQGRVDFSAPQPDWRTNPCVTLNYLPRKQNRDETYDVVYTSVRDTGRYWAAMKAKLIEEVKVDDTKPHDHRADNDAEHIASFYANCVSVYPDLA